MIDEKKLIEEITTFGERMTNNGMQGDFHLKIIKAVTDIIANQPKVDEWTPVSELPKEDGKYIVCTKKGSVYCAKYTNDYEYFHTDSYTHIIAWQPLPEPYKQ